MARIIKIDAKPAFQKLKELSNQLSKQKIASIATMSLNRAAKSARTEAKRSIAAIYNIKPSLVDNSDTRRGLSILPATKSTLTAEVKAGHKPIALSNFPVKFQSKTIAYNLSSKPGKSKGKAVKRSIGEVFVAIKKGDYKAINTAFVPGVVKHTGGSQITTPAIFARGKRGKPTFSFGKSRYPIDTLSSVSVYSAVLNDGVNEKMKKKADDVLNAEIERNIKRLIQKL
jgi:hypothetical protein